MSASPAPVARPACAVLAAVSMLALAMPARAQGDAQAADRGRLLYETHCIACHSTQMHWRDRRVVQDWASLLGQVGAWQAREKLGWSAADIRAVAEHLNTTIYRLADAPVRGE